MQLGSGLAMIHRVGFKAVLSRCEWGKDDSACRWRTCRKLRRQRGQVELLSGLAAETQRELK